MFERTRGQQLRILTGQRDPDTWLSRYPAILTDYVAIRSFTSKDGQGHDRPAFHDRYLNTPDNDLWGQYTPGDEVRAREEIDALLN